ncbi:Bacteriophage replication protein O [Sporotomaculum syntrophicum]|uniref:Bacteriophage replication protein O n=1 Tax=Sporotomaculum syntrophicum TaxID=182264 RepID=A0A9D2WQ98_9FIRM|nr:replication protein [Sporotomaculum syntrophicum]KAF1084946.1 Bacteriophage replication protein O [Sporotomaculum syntrophicum]
MANPQPGEFTRISNKLFEAIILTNFKKRQLNIILLVIRLSYGCGRDYAVLRQADFKIIGIDKSDINKELQLLAECGVLTVTGNRVALNKDYDCWRIARARPGGADSFKQLLRRNLEEKAGAGLCPARRLMPTTPGGSPPGGAEPHPYKYARCASLKRNPEEKTVGETPTAADEIVGETPTTANAAVGETPTRELVNHQPANWQNTNSGVGEPPTPQTPQGNGGKGLEGAERYVKETLKKRKDKEKDLCVFDLHFEKFWTVYPRQVEKKRAYRCFKLCIREGLAEGLTMESLVKDLVNAAANYAGECRRQGTQPRYIKHAATFLGPDKPYLDWLKPPVEESGVEHRLTDPPDRQADEKRKLLESLYLS